MNREFDGLYAKTGRPSIPPERLLRALLLQIFYSIRSERMLMEQLSYNLLFRRMSISHSEMMSIRIPDGCRSWFPI